MHWDPGPYWDWEHYFDLLGAPIAADGVRRSSRSVTVAPGFDDNAQPVTGCDRRADGDAVPGRRARTSSTCDSQPDLAAPLVTDVGLRPDGAPVDDGGLRHRRPRGGRPAAGRGAGPGRLGPVWWLGAVAWVYNPAATRSLVPSPGQVVTPAGGVAVPVYGRAYPEEAAYPEEIPYQTVTPLQYTIKPGQSYVVGGHRHRDRLLLREDVPLQVRRRLHRGHGADRVLPDLVRPPDRLRPRRRRDHPGRPGGRGTLTERSSSLPDHAPRALHSGAGSAASRSGRERGR